MNYGKTIIEGIEKGGRIMGLLTDGLALSVVFLYLWVLLLERKIRALEKRTA